ncbi:MAG: hypothetical protein Q7J75_01025 [Rhodoferax sp.]|nr:hypothetical protein [Rhodoferax sp.]
MTSRQRPDAYELSHIPGAAYLDTHCLEDGPLWNKIADHLLLDIGVRHSATRAPQSLVFHFRAIRIS